MKILVRMTIKTLSSTGINEKQMKWMNKICNKDLPANQ